MSRWRRQLNRRHARARAARYLNYFPSRTNIRPHSAAALFADLLNRPPPQFEPRLVIATPDGRVLLPDGTTVQLEREPPASVEEWAKTLAGDLAALDTPLRRE